MSYKSKYIHKLGLKIVEIKKINLITSYPQYVPQRSIDDYFDGGLTMPFSPHAELAALFFKKGK